MDVLGPSRHCHYAPYCGHMAHPLAEFFWKAGTTSSGSLDRRGKTGTCYFCGYGTFVGHSQRTLGRLDRALGSSLFKRRHGRILRHHATFYRFRQ